ncbi:MAG TPA: UDP-glucose/GDP-mannose dehydrogenase family protein [Candidatus Binatia bacterium]|nr:UDP-glucose/GDP-mannose dehydrogenase family protein [Candidatus Binatia bacterium]
MATGADDRVICVIGAGYVGVVTAAGLAESGRRVHLVEVDARRRATVAAGRSPIHEPGLDELLAEVVANGRLTTAETMREGVAGAGIVIVAVGTPPTPGGEADLSQVRGAVDEAVRHAGPGTVIAIKSTVPPGTTRSLARSAGRADISFVMFPEFLREGAALHDMHHPSRVVVGGDDPQAVSRIAALFGAIDTSVVLCDSVSAELIKYGSNAFLATKISFINEMAQLCELTGADITKVADGMGLDPRIGRSFLSAGLGWGGSCFPKDVRALETSAGYHGQSFWLLKAAIEVNSQQRSRFVGKLRHGLGGSLEGRRVTVLGLAFKPFTDDLRQAPSLEVIRHLEDLGAEVTATDPVALSGAEAVLPRTRLVADPYEALAGADAAGLVTDWPEYRELDWARALASMRGRLVVDGRNWLDGEAIARQGGIYVCMGRAPVAEAPPATVVPSLPLG